MTYRNPAILAKIVTTLDGISQRLAAPGIGRPLLVRADYQVHAQLAQLAASCL